MRNENPYAALENMSGALDDISLSKSPKQDLKQIPRYPPSPSSGSSQVVGADTEVEYEMDHEEMFELEFKQHKRHYYIDKFKMEVLNYE